MSINYISSISIDNLLIFIGFGITFLVFSVQSKLAYVTRREFYTKHGMLRSQGLFKFIKTLFNWGIFYFISGIILLWCSVITETSTLLRPILYNLAFIMVFNITMYFTLAYIALVLFEMVKTLIIASKYHI